MNAQLKPNEQAALELRLQQRRGDVFEIDHDKKEKEHRRDCLLEHINDHARACLDEILLNHQALDEAENGRILSNAIASYASSLMTARLMEELREDFMPSWRSRCEP